MSIKIYNGYILPLMDLSELQAFSQSFRGKISEESKKLITLGMANKCVNTMDFMFLSDEQRSLFDGIDSYVNREENWENSAAYAAYELMVTQENEFISKRSNNPLYDFTCDVVFFPLEDCTLAMLYASQKTYADLFREMPGVEPYFYWDNTDMLEDITEEDWDARKDKWIEALGDTAIPSLEGFTVSCYTRMPFINVEDIAACAKENCTFEARVMNMASKFIIFDKYKELKEKHKDETPFNIYTMATNYLKGDEAKVKISDQKEIISSLLKEEYEIGDYLIPLASLAESSNS